MSWITAHLTSSSAESFYSLHASSSSTKKLFCSITGLLNWVSTIISCPIVLAKETLGEEARIQQAVAEQDVAIQRQLAERANVQPQIRQQQRQLLASNNTKPNESPGSGMANGRPSQSPNSSRTPINSYATQPSLGFNSAPTIARSAYSGNQAPIITQTFKVSVQPTPTVRASYRSSLPSVIANPGQRGYSSYSIKPTHTGSTNGVVASNSPQTRVEALPDSTVDGTQAAADTGTREGASLTRIQDWTCSQCAGINSDRLATRRCLECGHVRK